MKLVHDANAKKANGLDKKIGLKINELRVSKGVSRQELADGLGITHQQLQKYEKGVNRIAASRLVELADLLNISVIHFFADFTEDMDVSTLHKQRASLSTMQNFSNIKDDVQKEALRQLIKTLAAD